MNYEVVWSDLFRIITIKTDYPITIQTDYHSNRSPSQPITIQTDYPITIQTDYLRSLTTDN
ncbi:MAG: hypothetical protein KA767_16315 [Saprospiraceae bacterium]|jgi:hypothetical protein|nr:hypothetical protein [Saprospiraceae bacterium]MCI1265220.1 hypothetical protein [Saprospiraceae bacterium]